MTNIEWYLHVVKDMVQRLERFKGEKTDRDVLEVRMEASRLAARLRRLAETLGEEGS